MAAEVRPGVYTIAHEMLPGTSVVITLLTAERVAIVDSGLATTPGRCVLPALSALGIAPQRVAYVINTHGHGDHVRGNAELVEATGATVLAHGADRELIEQPRPALDARFAGIVPSDHAAFGALPVPNRPPAPVGRTLADGDLIELGSRQLRVIHAPGHSAGAVLLFDEAAGLLITGDALQGRGTTGSLGTYVPLINDVEAYRETLAMARALAPEVVITAHAFRPCTTTVLDSRSWHELVVESAAAVDEVAACLMHLLHKARGRARLSTLAQGLCAQFGYDGITTCSLITAAAMLEDLSRQRLIVGPEPGPDGAWCLPS